MEESDGIKTCERTNKLWGFCVGERLVSKNRIWGESVNIMNGAPFGRNSHWVTAAVETPQPGLVAHHRAFARMGIMGLCGGCIGIMIAKPKP